MQSSGMSSRGSRIPTKPSAVPEKDSRELPGQSDTTGNEPIKKFSGRSPATLPGFGWKAKSKLKDSDYHRSK
jgi:hypothetical protein